MKLFALAAAAVSALFNTVPASAQTTVMRTVTREAPAPAERVVEQRHVTRSVVTRRGSYAAPRRVCRVRYAHGQRIRTCRVTRY